MSRTLVVYVLFLFGAGLLLGACGGVAVSDTPEALPGTGSTPSESSTPTLEIAPTTAMTPTLELEPTTVMTPTEIATMAPELTVTTGTGTGMTAQDLADAGEQVYADNCAVCHGENGEGGVGPAVIGATQVLTTFTNATELYAFVQTHAQQNVQGTLTEEQILDVVAFLLVKNNLVPPETPLDIQALTNITIP